MTIEKTLSELAASSVDKSSWQPSLFSLTDPAHRSAIEELLAAGKIAAVHDEIEDQLGELLSTREPHRKLKGEALAAEVRRFLGEAGLSAAEYGTWVYYPWTKRLVHVLPEASYRELRSSRNRYKITGDEQRRLSEATIGVVGLSVGLSSAITFALEGIGGKFRLADFDLLALSNMNRLRTPLYHLAVNKSYIAAREMFEVDPYLKIELYPHGLNEDEVDKFLAGNGKLDLLVEECDDLYIKVLVRERAKALQIPVIMDTNDRGMLDIERFDLEPERPVLHGLLDKVSAAHIKGLKTNKDKVPYVVRIFGAIGMQPRTVASLFEIEKSVSSWPQLASGTVLGGALTCDVGRRILLDELRGSGRFYVDLDELIKDGAAAPLQIDRSLDDVLHRKALPLDIPPLARSTPGPELSVDDIRTLVSYATLAPSAGNVQPWRFISKGNTIRCELDESRAWVFLDFERSATYVAFGAAVENMALAAAAMGIDADIRPFPDASDPRVICDVVLTPGRGEEDGPAPDSLASQMARRATNRKYASRVPLPEDAVTDMKGAAEEAGARFLLVTKDEELTEIASLIGAADRVMYLSKRLHHELTHELRWTQKEVEATRDGVDVATMELSPPDLAGLRLAMSWPGMELLGKVGGGRAMEDASRKAIDASSAVGVVVGEGTSPEAYFKAGRALERVWLTAAAHDLAMHPLSGMVYLFARVERGGGEGLSEGEVETLKGLRERYLKLFDVAPGKEAEVLLFRLGVADPPTLRSLRRPVEEVLIFEEEAPARARRATSSKKKVSKKTPAKKTAAKKTPAKKTAPAKKKTSTKSRPAAAKTKPSKPKPKARRGR
jgi:nitroreductase